MQFIDAREVFLKNRVFRVDLGTALSVAYDDTFQMFECDSKIIIDDPVVKYGCLLDGLVGFIHPRVNNDASS